MRRGDFLRAPAEVRKSADSLDAISVGKVDLGRKVFPGGPSQGDTTAIDLMTFPAGRGLAGIFDLRDSAVKNRGKRRTFSRVPQSKGLLVRGLARPLP